MNNNSASQYMDKQIMDLTNPQSPSANNSNSGSNNDFIDFMNREPEKKEGIVASYDFMPIRPTVRSSSPPAARTSNLDSGDDDAPLRSWNSVGSKNNTSPIRNYGSVDADEPSKFVLGKNYYKPTDSPLDASLVSEIDRTMKKYADNLMHAVDGLSARLSQLETRTHNLENSIDDLKVSVGNSHGSTDGKMRLLENILREVQSGVLVVKDKQEILEAQLQISKLQVSKGEQEAESRKVEHPDSANGGASNHQISSISPTLPTPNAPPTPQPQNIPSQIQIPNQFPPNQLSSVPQRDSYFPQPNQTPENPSQQYQMPPPLQPQHQPTSPLPHHQPAPPPPLQYQSPPQPQYSQSSTLSQPQPPFSAVNPALSHVPSGGLHPDDAQYISTQTYPPAIRPPTSLPATGGPTPPTQQYYVPSPSVYEPPSRPGTGYSGSFGPSSGHGDSYPPYSGSPSQYGGGSPMKAQQHSSPGMGQSGGSGYPQLPTARILPQALPTASAVGSSSSSGGSGNRVPIDDVVDRVTNMGFPRDQVRETVRRLTENGQAVDLNIVLDKLMNDGEVRGSRGSWFGR